MVLGGPARPCGILVAVEEEARAVLTRLLPRSRGRLGRFPFWRGTLARREVALLQSGPGLRNAEEAVRLLVDRQDPVALLSAGLAGGLAEGRARGEVLLAIGVLHEEGVAAWEVDPRLVLAGRRAAQDLGERADIKTPGYRSNLPAVVEGMVVSRDRVLVTALEKKRTGQETGADVVDMETRAVAAVARERGLPWMAVRVVSDSVAEDLPLDFNDFVGPTGHPRRLRILFEGLKRPSLLAQLVELERATARAGEGLAIYLEALMPRLGEALS